MRIITVIFFVSTLSSCNFLKDCFGVDIYSHTPLGELDSKGLDSLFLATEGKFIVIEASADDYFSEEEPILEEDYRCEYTKIGSLVQVKTFPDYTRRVWISYWKPNESGYFDNCTRKGRIKGKNRYSYFSYADIEVNELDSIRDIHGFSIHVQRKDTTHNNHMRREIYRSGELVERWTGWCHEEGLCDWDKSKN